MTRRRHLATLLLVALGLSGAPPPAAAFGPTGQQAVVLKSIDTLPKPLSKFYKDHRLEMPTLSPEAAPSGDRAPGERFELDRL